MGEAGKVVWSEGLFLRTQHFQQQDRFTEGLVRGALQGSPARPFPAPPRPTSEPPS